MILHTSFDDVKLTTIEFDVSDKERHDRQQLDEEFLGRLEYHDYDSDLADDEWRQEVANHANNPNLVRFYCDGPHHGDQEAESAFREGFSKGALESLLAIESSDVDLIFDELYELERSAKQARQAAREAATVGHCHVGNQAGHEIESSSTVARQSIRRIVYRAGHEIEAARTRGRDHGLLSGMRLFETLEAEVKADSSTRELSEMEHEAEQARLLSLIRSHVPAFTAWVERVQVWAASNCDRLELMDYYFETVGLKLADENSVTVPERSEDESNLQPPTVATPTSTDDVQRNLALRATAQQILRNIGTGTPVRQTLQYAQAKLQQVGETFDVEPPRLISSAELDAADLRTDYLVDGVLARHQPCIIAAGKKSLKTTIAIDLVLSLASGAKFLGKFYVRRPVRVGFISGESGDAVIQETARRIAKTKPWWNLSDYKNVCWGFDLPKLGQPQSKKTLVRLIIDSQLDVMIIDPAYLCLDLGDTDAGNLFGVGKKLFELTEIGRETGCTMIIIHHNRKAHPQNQFAVPELESIAWSGFQEWARQWILLGRREPFNPEQAGSHKLWLSFGGSAGHSGLYGLDIEEGAISDPRGRRWEVAIDGAKSVISESIERNEQVKQDREAAKIEKRLNVNVAKLLKAYEQFPNGETARFYASKARLSCGDATAANDQLILDGKIEPFDVLKGNGQTYPGFRIVKSTETGFQNHRDTETALRDSQSSLSVAVPSTHTEREPLIGGLSVSQCEREISDSEMSSIASLF